MHFGQVASTLRMYEPIDRIAILAVYLPTICTEVTHYVDEWNTHFLRKQPNRPKSISGRPITLFYRPKLGIKNYSLSLHRPTLAQLRRDVEDYSKFNRFHLSVVCTKLKNVMDVLAGLIRTKSSHMCWPEVERSKYFRRSCLYKSIMHVLVGFVRTELS